MPISPNELFRKAACTYAGTVPWGTRPHIAGRGIYAISQSSDPACGKCDSAPCFDLPIITAWIGAVPMMRFDGAVPKPPQLAAYLETFWHAGEPIVYIGKAGCLNERVAQFFSHRLGNSSPHKGGHWVKTLANLRDLWIHCATCDENELQVERRALTVFQGEVLACKPNLATAPVLAIPFANRQHGPRKQRRLSPEHR